jgi:hypothetical protein
MNFASFDTETLLFRPGEQAPRVVCASAARIIDGTIKGELLGDRHAAHRIFKSLLESNFIISFANASYDLAVMAQQDPDLMASIFRAIREGRIHCVLLAESLNAIFGGHLGLNPDFSQMRKPSTGEITSRYSLEIVTKLVLGRTDAKENDAWRKSYALLEGIPVERWPIEARVYPVDDAVNTLEISGAQIYGIPGRGPHEWIKADEKSDKVCSHCGGTLTFSWPTPGEPCPKSPPVPHKNLGNLSAQVEADFCLKLGNAHSLRTDPEAIDKVEAEAEAKHKIAVERFQKRGWIREDGTEDQAAVKRSLAASYGATIPCRRCGGTGRVRNPVEHDCRGLKVRGRYQECPGDACTVCNGRRKIWKYGNEVTCKNIFADDSDVIVTAGCDGSGFDLSEVPLLPRTEKQGVKTDRDAKMESGDDDLSDFGEDEWAKALSTYIPYLRTGVDAPLDLNPDALKESGRCSYGTIHQFPRKGGLRECIRARGPWCGVEEPHVLSSTDYAAGELCALGQVTYWYEGESRMLELINSTKDPGALHTMTAAQMLGITLEEAKARIKAGNQQAKDFRQASKPASFGFPGGLGSATLVLISRRKNAGTTITPDGHEYVGIRFCVLLGGRERCGEEKVIEWNRKPCAPICKACVRIVEEMLKPTFFKLYPEVRRYLDRISSMTRGGRPIPAPAWNPEKQCIEILRLRGNCGYTDGANQGFQGLLSDIGKRAYCRMTREAYLGVKDDGSPSVLAGARFPVFMHDEPLGEHRLSVAHVQAPRVGEIMVECGHELAPDVYWEAKPALMWRWFKEAEPVFNSAGHLIPWEPKKKSVEPKAEAA